MEGESYLFPCPVFGVPWVAIMKLILYWPSCQSSQYSTSIGRDWEHFHLTLSHHD